MEYRELREIVATDYATITTHDQEISLTNANDSLFTYPPATGIKTGMTPAAGPSLASLRLPLRTSSTSSAVLGAKEELRAACIRALEHSLVTNSGNQNG